MAGYTDGQYTKLGAQNNVKATSTALQIANFKKDFLSEVYSEFEENSIISPKFRQVNGSGTGNISINMDSQGYASFDIETPNGETHSYSQINRAPLTIEMDPALDFQIILSKNEMAQAISKESEMRHFARKAATPCPRLLDILCAIKILQGAAATTPRVTGTPLGTTITLDTAAAPAEVAIGEMVDSIYAMMSAFDTKHIPPMDRCLFLLPAVQARLARSTDLLDVDYGTDGSVVDGRVRRTATYKIYTTTHIPTANIEGTNLVDTLETGPKDTGGSGRAATVAASNNNYVFNATKTIGLAIGEQAGVVGTWSPFKVTMSTPDSYTQALRAWYVTSIMQIGVQYMKEASCGRILVK